MEGNVFVVMRSMGEGEEMENIPRISVWPTHSIQSIIMDDQEEGNGIALGYVVQPPNQNQIQISGDQNGYRVVYPSLWWLTMCQD